MTITLVMDDMTNHQIIQIVTAIETAVPEFEVEFFGYNNDGRICALLMTNKVIFGKEDEVIDWCHESIAY